LVASGVAYDQIEAAVRIDATVDDLNKGPDEGLQCGNAGGLVLEQHGVADSGHVYLSCT
jgi:hypothetical protein